MKRALAVAATSVVALVLGAGAAAANPVPVYPPPSEPTLQVSAGALCVGDVPYYNWEVTVDDEATTGKVTITFRNPSGRDHVLKGQPLTGQAMWPGAKADSDGNGTDWPGWRLEDGVWVEGDEWDWTLPTVEVEFESNPSAVATLTYPLPDARCAGPADPPPAPPAPNPDEDDDLPDLLGLTGSQVGGALGGIAALLAIGTVLIVIRRRTQH